MPEECIKSSKACAYVLGGSSGNSSLFDFDGVYILDGGFAENTAGFVAHVRSISAVLLSAPTKKNLGTVTALLEQNESVPVYTNSNPLKVVKPGSSAEQVKRIQEANNKLLAVEIPLFTPKYQPYIIYQSADKGILSLYVLAGDAKDGEAIMKALASGNEAEVERAAAEHGTIAILLWRPTQGSMPAIRALLSGTSSMIRIQKSLDKAARYLPFLNTSAVKSKDALTYIPPPTAGATRPSPPGARPLTRPTPPSSGSRAAAATARAPLRATITAPPTRPLTTSRPVPATKTASAVGRTRTFAPTASSTSAPARKTTPPVHAPPFSSRPSADRAALKKTVSKVQSVVPTKHAPAGKKAPVSKTTAPPTKKPTPPPSVATTPDTPPATTPGVQLDDSVICLSDSSVESPVKPLDIVVIPPTPETPLVEPTIEDSKALLEDVEPETPPPAQCFPKQESTPTESKDETPQEPQPTPVAPEVSEGEKSELTEISTNANKSATEADAFKPLGEISQLASNLQEMGLNDKTQEYVQNLSNQMIEEATLPFTAAFANSIACGDTIKTSGEESPLRDAEVQKHDKSAGLSEQAKEVSKHDLMQSRSSVLEHGIPVQYQQTDPVLDDILDTCANESDKLDAAHSDTLHMPERPGVPIAKSVKFARPYYFDVVTVPHNGNQELTVDADSIREFVSKIRSRNLILPSKDISIEQLNAIVTGKQFWCESAHPCTIIPTVSSPTLVDFRAKNEASFPEKFLSLASAVDKQRTTVSSASAGTVEYELARLPFNE